MIPIALFGIILVALLLYGWMPARQAMLAVMLGAAMFLPNTGYQVPLLRQYDKFNSASLSVLLAILLLDFDRLKRFRFHWIDIPMALWCLCPLISSLTNDLGIYDGLAEADGQFIQWGLPYLIGRFYFMETGSLDDLASALLKAGLILMPLCLVEIAKGPLFHVKVYDFYPHNYWEQFRYGGWRPSVFFMHGLWLGWFMTVATLAGLFIWRTGRPRAIFHLPVRYVTPVLFVVTVYCKSTGALTLLGLGLVVLWAGQFRKVLLALLIVSPLIYVGLRVTQTWSGEHLVSLATSSLGEDRASSLSARFDLEDLIIGRAMLRPWFGWGGWNRSLVGTTAWTEGVWTQEIGRHGLLGVLVWMGSLLLPAGLFWWRFRHRLNRLDASTAAPIFMITLGPLLTIYYLTVLDFSSYNPMMLGALASAAVATPMTLPVLAGVVRRGVYRRRPQPLRPGNSNPRSVEASRPAGRRDGAPHAS